MQTDSNAVQMNTAVQYGDEQNELSSTGEMNVASNLPSDWVVYKHFHDSAPTNSTHDGVVIGTRLDQIQGLLVHT